MASEDESCGSANSKSRDRRISKIGRYGYRLSGSSFKGRFGSNSSPSAGVPPTTTHATTSSQPSASSPFSYPPKISLTSSSGSYSNLSADCDQNPPASSTSLRRHLSLSQKRRRSPRTSNSNNTLLGSNNANSDSGLPGACKSDSGASSNRSSANASPRSSLTNKIGDYASRYLDTIRPKWGSSSGGGGNAGTNRAFLGASRSTSSSRSESPLNPPLGPSSTSSTMPHVLTFRQRERVSPSTSYALPPHPSPTHLSDSRPKRSFSPTLKPYPDSGSDR